MRFKNVRVGEWFDFDDPNATATERVSTPHRRYRKVSARGYVWIAAEYPDAIAWDTAKVGTVNVRVFHVSADS